MQRQSWLLLFFAFGATALAAQQRAVEIPRVARPVAFDEVLRWVGAPPDHGANGGGAALDVPLGVRVDGFVQREPGDGVPVSQATTAYLSYDDANLYVVFVCHDDPAKVRANVARREDIGDDDQVVLYLDTFRDRKRAYVFVANPFGVQRDGILTEAQGEDMSFDAVWRSEGRLTEAGYVVRLSIPFRSLRFSNDSVQTWGLALQRVIQRTNEDAYWPYITKRVKGLVPQFATARGLARISPGRNAQVTPYSVLARARVLDDDIPGYVTEGEERIGMDAKAVVRGAFTVDATVNPDFSQVETDDPQVTVNRRFEVFFPEKRPFFLEDAGYFQTPVNLLFSRRIVDPGAGLRLTGKAGRWAIAALGINDRAAVASGDPAAGLDTWVGAVRVQRELGEESTVGFLVTDREFLQSWKTNRMYSADARWRAGDNWSVAAQVMRSENRDHDGIRSAGWGVLGDVSFDSRNFEYAAKYLEHGPTFAAPLGFVSRAGFRRTEHDAEYTVRPEGGPVTQYGPSVVVNVFWDHATGQLLDREVEAAFQVELRGNTKLQLTRVDAFERFDGLGFRPYVTQVDFSTEWLKWLGLEAFYSWGAAVNHDPADGLIPTRERAVEAEVGVTVRPTPRLRFEQTVTHAELRTAGGSPIVRERQVRSKLHYQFSRFLSLRLIVDYDAESGDTTLADVKDESQWRGDVLFTYLVNPGTALYLGYTDRYENLAIAGRPPTLIPRPSPETSTARQLFLKLSYLWRF